MGVGVGLLLPPDALQFSDAGRGRQTATLTVPDVEAAPPRREDSPLAPPLEGEPGAQPVGQPQADTVAAAGLFGICSGGGGDNCVVDGDTFRHRGEKIRIADIDTPELNPARCAAEEELGQAAKARLRVLLNAGPFRLEPVPGRDSDDYGRKLRVVVRDGRSLGDQLVAEGLARTWTGRRQPWC